MLSQNQMDVLEHIVANEAEFITDLARSQGIKNPKDSVGIAEFIVGDPENFSQMSDKQIYHYEKAIKPLISRVPCEGMLREKGSCLGDDFVDEDSLLEAYLARDMRCQHCISTKESWFANNP
jgi:hypothetical protein